MYWHISWKVWLIYVNVCWVNVNKSKKMVSLVAKIEYVIINSNWTQEIMAGQKKKLSYSEETLWFPEYYIGWIGIGNCDQETSSTEGIAKRSIPTSCKITGEFCSENMTFCLLILREFFKNSDRIYHILFWVTFLW